MLEYRIRTKTPHSHIEACSIINFFRCEIVSSDILKDPDSIFYGEFLIKSSVEAYTTFEEFASDGIIIEII